MSKCKQNIDYKCFKVERRFVLGLKTVVTVFSLELMFGFVINKGSSSVHYSE